MKFRSSKPGLQARVRKMQNLQKLVPAAAKSNNSEESGSHSPGKNRQANRDVSPLASCGVAPAAPKVELYHSLPRFTTGPATADLEQGTDIEDEFHAATQSAPAGHGDKLQSLKTPASP